MTKEEKLIWLYLYICEAHDTVLCLHCQRLSNNFEPEFSDAELITTYLFTIIEEKRFEIKSIHRFIQQYWLSWFPKLPSYTKYAYRLNRMAEVFPALIEGVLQNIPKDMIYTDISLVDSFPIIVASPKRCSKARTASDICDKTLSASKGHWYYGSKLHVVAWKRYKTIPIPEYIGLTTASEHDVRAFKRISRKIKNRQLFGDKAYGDKELKEVLENKNNAMMNAANKMVRGQAFEYSDDKLHATLISKARQPLESLFNWLIEKTGIQKASKVRSTTGLQVHVFGKMAAAVFMLAFDFLNS